MSSVAVYSDFIVRGEQAKAELASIQAYFTQVIAGIDGQTASINLIASDGLTPAVAAITAEIEAMPIEVPLIASDGVSTALDAIRAEAEAAPIIVPVEMAGGGDEAAGDDGEAGAAGGRGGGGMARGIRTYTLVRTAIEAVKAAIESARIAQAAWNQDFDAQVSAAKDLKATIDSLPFGIGKAADSLGGAINNLITGNADYEASIKAQVEEEDKHTKMVHARAEEMKKVTDEAEKFIASLEKANEKELSDHDKHLAKLNDILAARDKILAKPEMHVGGNVAGALTDEGKQVNAAADKSVMMQDQKYWDDQAEKDADEQEKIADRKFAYLREAMHAYLASYKGDQQQELADFEKLWDAKIAKIEDAGEKEAALSTKAAEHGALVRRQQMENDVIAARTRDDLLESEGKKKEAQLDDLEDKIKKAIDAGGDDLASKNAQRALGVAELEKYKATLDAIKSSVTSLSAYSTRVLLGGLGGSNDDIGALRGRANADEQKFKPVGQDTSIKQDDAALLAQAKRIIGKDFGSVGEGVDWGRFKDESVYGTNKVSESSGYGSMFDSIGLHAGGILSHNGDFDMGGSMKKLQDAISSPDGGKDPSAFAIPADKFGKTVDKWTPAVDKFAAALANTETIG